MAETQQKYRLLPGQGLSRNWQWIVLFLFCWPAWLVLSRVSSRLYLGADHLMRVTTNWTETYRRFYYNDIRALVICRTKRGLIWNIVLAVLCALFLLWGVLVDELVGRITLSCIAALFGGFLLVNVFKGPTCKVKIYTHVGSEPLPSLRRLRLARKVIALLKPEILAAQGELLSEEVPVQLQGLQAAAQSQRQQSASRPATRSANAGYLGAVHGWLFGALLAEVLGMTAMVTMQGTAAAIVVGLAVLGVMGLTVVSLVKQSGSRLASGLQTATWTSLAHMIMNGGLGYVLLFYTVIRNPKIANNQWLIFKKASSIPILDTPWLAVIFFFQIVFALVLAVTGWILLGNWRASIRNEEAAAAEATVS